MGNPDTPARPLSPEQRADHARDRLAEVPKQEALLARAKLIVDIVKDEKFPSAKKEPDEADYVGEYADIAGPLELEGATLVGDAEQLHRDIAAGDAVTEAEVTTLLRAVTEHVRRVREFKSEYAKRRQFIMIEPRYSLGIENAITPQADRVLNRMGLVLTMAQRSILAGTRIKPEEFEPLAELYQKIRTMYLRPISRPPAHLLPLFLQVERGLRDKEQVMEETVIRILPGVRVTDLKAEMKGIQDNRAVALETVANVEKARDLLARNADLLTRDPDGYLKKRGEIEAEYLKKMGLQGVTPQEFRDHTRLLRTPLTPLPGPGDADAKDLKEGDIAVLRQMHGEIERLQLSFALRLDEELFTLQVDGKIDDKKYEERLTEMLVLSVRRDTYERMRKPKTPPPPNTLLAKIGMFAEAMADNYAMEGAGLGRVNTIYTVRAQFSALPPAAQHAMLEHMTTTLFKDGYLIIEDANLVLRNEGLLKGIADKAMRRGVTVVLSPALTAAEITRVTEALIKAGLAPRLVTQGLQGLELMDVATRNAFLKGVKEAQQMLGSSVTSEEFANLLKTVKFEGGMMGVAKDLLHVKVTPGMYILFAIYMHQCDNKMEAAMMLASFLIAGNFIDAVVMDRMLARWIPALMRAVGLVVPAERMILLMRGIPGPIKIALVLAACFYGEKYITDFVKAIDKLLPANQVGFVLQSVISGVMLDPAFELIDQATFASGVRTVNPERDWQKHIGRETLVGVSGKGYYLNTGNWNQVVDQAIAQERSSVMKQKWELEKINDAWLKRQAVDLNAKVGAMRRLASGMRESIAAGATKSYDQRTDRMVDTPDEKVKELQGKITAAKIQSGFDCMLDITTGNAPPRYQRNDLELEWSLAGEIAEGVRLSWNLDPRARDVLELRRAMEGLPEDHELRRNWNFYLMNARATAKTVGLLRHMQWQTPRGPESLYDPAKMIQPEGGPMTDYLREGMVEKVKYSIARRRMENQVNFRTQRAVDAVPPGGSPVPVLPRTDNRRVND